MEINYKNDIAEKSKTTTKPLTVLITACGNAYMPGTCKTIKENGEREIRLIGADMNKDDTILEMCDAYYQVPSGNDPKYVENLLDICRKERADILIPIMALELEALSANKERFEAIGTKVSISDNEQLKIANNKLLLFNFLKSEGLPCPNYYPVRSLDDVDKAIDKIGLPIVFKTAEGSGSRGMRIIDDSKSRFDILFHEKPNSSYTTLKEFKEILVEGGGKFPEMIAMEYLPGSEYTVDLLVEHGDVKYSMCRRGLNIQTSIILDGVVEDRPRITEMCNEIAFRLKLTGNVGFDVKERSDGTPVIMECNPRATAGVAEFVPSGVNFLYLCIKMMMGEKLPVLKPRYGIIMRRRYMEMYDYVANSNGREV